MNKIFLQILTLSMAGCINITPQLGFKEVSDNITALTNNSLHWRNGSDEDKQVDDKINTLLKTDLTIETVTQIALLNNRNLQATYQNLGLAQADLVQAGLLTNPIFNGDLRFPSNGSIFEFSVVQNFLEILDRPLRKKIATSKFQEAKIEVTKEALTLAYQVKRSFYRYVALKNILEISKKALLTHEASKDLAKKQHDAGNITDLELAEKQSEYEALKIKISDQEDDLLTEKENLNIFMGIGKDQLNWNISAKLPETIELKVMDQEIEQKALENNLELAKAHQQFITLTTNLGIAEEFKFLNNTTFGLKGEKDPDEKWALGPQIQVPIPLFSQGQVEIFRANAELNQNYKQILYLTNKIESYVRTLRQKFSIADKRRSNYKKTLLPLNKKIVSETQKQYNAMLKGVYDLMEAKLKDINSEKDYTESLERYLLAGLDLEFLINGIFPSEVDK